MRQVLLTILFPFYLILGTSPTIFANETDTLCISGPEVKSASQRVHRHVNFFVVSKRKPGKFDPASRFNVFRAKIKSFFRKKKFVAIVAEDAGQMSSKVQRHLKKNKANLGTLWFDSHGMYKKGYSLFFIGHDEYSYYSLQDSAVAEPLRQLAAFADEKTNVVIGSCYGGATYHRASIDYADTTCMNGDSLMIALGNIFQRSTIYGSESWVMTKPGLFLKRAAVAGHPSRKLFLDICYQPAWERIGKWNEYNAQTSRFSSINPLTMDMYGNVLIRTLPYAEKDEVRKTVTKKLQQLKPGLYK